VKRIGTLFVLVLLLVSQGLIAGVATLDSSPGQLLGMSRERSEYYVWDNVESEIEEKMVIYIRSMKDGALKKTVYLKKGDCAAPNELCAPTFLQFHDGKFFIYDVNHKIVVYDKDFNYLYSSRYYQSRHFVDFFGNGPNYRFVIGKSDIKGEKIEMSININSLDNQHLVKTAAAIDSFQAKLKRKRTVNNGVRNIDYLFFTPTIHGFEQKGSIIYSANTQNSYTIYNPKTATKKVITLPQLKAKLYTLEEARKTGYFKTNGIEEKRKKRGLIFHYTPYHKETHHLGMLKTGPDTIGFISKLDSQTMTLHIDIIQTQTRKPITQYHVPAGKSFTHGIALSGPGFRPTCIDHPTKTYIWQDHSPDFEKVTKYSRIE
jgi:hypothetical protein